MFNVNVYTIRTHDGTGEYSFFYKLSAWLFFNFVLRENTVVVTESHFTGGTFNGWLQIQGIAMMQLIYVFRDMLR